MRRVVVSCIDHEIIIQFIVHETDLFRLERNICNVKWLQNKDSRPWAWSFHSIHKTSVDAWNYEDISTVCSIGKLNFTWQCAHCGNDPFSHEFWLDFKLSHVTVSKPDYIGSCYVTHLLVFEQLASCFSNCLSTSAVIISLHLSERQCYRNLLLKYTLRLLTDSLEGCSRLWY